MPASVVSTRYGPMLIPSKDKYVGASLRANGAYCPEEMQVWREYIERGDTVLDIGANIGAHTLAFAEAVGAFGTVIAAEPQWGAFSMLCGTLAMNDCPQVRARWCAVGHKPGYTTFAVLDFDEENNFGGLAADMSHDTMERVPVEPIDSWPLERCDFIKVDVEGMELDVLKGAVKTIDRFHPILVVESDRRSMRSSMQSWMERHGYHVYDQSTPINRELFGDDGSFNYIGLPIGQYLDAPKSEWVTPIREAVAA